MRSRYWSSRLRRPFFYCVLFQNTRKACKEFEQMSNELYDEAEGFLYAPGIAD